MKNTVIKAIPTNYNGVEFRSRLEARWALFFDIVGYDGWLYENEGYQLPSGWYLPDFFFPQRSYDKDGDFFLEIKPTEPGKEELLSCQELCEATGKGVTIVGGQPSQGDHVIYSFDTWNSPRHKYEYASLLVRDFMKRGFDFRVNCGNRGENDTFWMASDLEIYPASRLNYPDIIALLDFHREIKRVVEKDHQEFRMSEVVWAGTDCCKQVGMFFQGSIPGDPIYCKCGKNKINQKFAPLLEVFEKVQKHRFW